MRSTNAQILHQGADPVGNRDIGIVKSNLIRHYRPPFFSPHHGHLSGVLVATAHRAARSREDW